MCVCVCVCVQYVRVLGNLSKVHYRHRKVVLKAISIDGERMFSVTTHLIFSFTLTTGVSTERPPQPLARGVSAAPNSEET